MGMDSKPGRKPMSYRRIAKLLGVTHQTVKNDEEKALLKLHSHPIMRQLAKELDLLNRDGGSC